MRLYLRTFLEELQKIVKNMNKWVSFWAYKYELACV